MSNGAPPDPALEAYKLEYQLAAARYENIYKALWQIFSYLSVVTGAILTFGGDRFQPNFLWVLAAFPLFFWYLSTYLPLNRYGDSCLARLADIEVRINALASSNLDHYRSFKNTPSKGFHARYAIHSLGVVLAVVLAWNACACGRALFAGTPLIREKGDSKLISISADDLKKLIQPSTGQAPSNAEPAKSGSQGQAIPSADAGAKKKPN